MEKSNRSDILFKDTITKKEPTYTKKIQDLLTALDSGDAAVKMLLLGTDTPKRYKGKYKRKQPADKIRPNDCPCIKNGSCSIKKTARATWEKAFFRCLFYWNRQNSCKYEPHDIEKEMPCHLIGDYRIVDYEVPAFFSGKGIGKIDLILEGKGALYAAEAKPYRQNGAESLLRMVAEILTYTLGDPAPGETEVYKRAILFFEKTPAAKDQKEKLTPQQEEYDEAKKNNSPIMTLIQKAEITVFHLKDATDDSSGKKTYQICRL